MRAIFTCVSLIILTHSFVVLRLVIGSKTSRHILSQSEAKARSFVICSRDFSRAKRRPHELTSRYDWLNGLPLTAVIGQSKYFD